MANKIKRGEAQRVTGFATVTYSLRIESDHVIIPGIPFKVVPFRRKDQTEALAIAIAGLIFSLLRNPDDEIEFKKVVEALDEESANQIAALGKEYFIDQPETQSVGFLDYWNGSKRAKFYTHDPGLKVGQIDTDVARAIAVA